VIKTKEPPYTKFTFLLVDRVTGLSRTFERSVIFPGIGSFPRLARLVLPTFIDPLSIDVVGPVPMTSDLGRFTPRWEFDIYIKEENGQWVKV
jgi:hypothetical protein